MFTLFVRINPEACNPKDALVFLVCTIKGKTHTLVTFIAITSIYSVDTVLSILKCSAYCGLYHSRMMFHSIRRSVIESFCDDVLSLHDC